MRNPESFRRSTILAAAVFAFCWAHSDATPETVSTRFSAPVVAQWKTVKDGTGGCRMSVPGDWNPGRDHPSVVYGPNASMALISVMDQQDPLKPLDAGEKQMFGFARTIESTPQRALFASKPTVAKAGRPSVIVYTAEVAGRPTCSATINVVPSQEELAKKIAASVGAVR